jgi:hypothetical protein
VAKKGRSTQTIVNAFPSWANTRNDEQSLGYQFINSVGLLLDDVRKQLARISDNQFLPTSIVSDIDLYYRVRLNDNYEFSKDDNDDTDFIFTPPTVSGIKNGNKYDVSIAEDNNIESFWYTPAPDRISLGDTVSIDHFVASGYIDKSPFSPQQEKLHIPNKLTVKVDGGTSFIGVEQNGQIRKGIVQIEGKNREGADLTEELIFVHDETLHTIHEFSEIEASGLRVYGIDNPSVTNLYVSSASFNQEDYPINYSLDENNNREDVPYFWAIGESTPSGVSTLDLKKYDVDDLELRLDGFITKHTFLQQELLDQSGNNISALDLAVEPHSDRIWIVDSDTLYVYDNALPYPSMSSLDGKNYDANSVIEPNTYYAVLGDEIQLDYIWRRPVQGLVAHRAWVTYPDGSMYSLEDGVEVTYHTDSASWIFGEPLRRKMRQSEFYTLNQRGNYTYSLQTRYTDETSSLDKRIISVISKSPQAELSLSSLGISNVIGVDFDSEYKLWVLDDSGTKYQINLHHDKMLIDFTRKIIYFREPYDQVRVI